MASKTKVLIIGMGELGKALGGLLEGKEEVGLDVWDIDRNKVDNWQLLEKVAPKKDFIFLAIPTAAVKKVIRQLKEIKKTKKTCLVLLSKGLNSDGQTSWQVAEDNWKGKKAMLSGPMIAEEIRKNKMAYGLAAGDKKKEISQLFKDTVLDLLMWDDPVGLSWCGPLKNIYAIGMGYAQKKDQGKNYLGCFLVTALQEMEEIIEKLDGEQSVVHTVSGLGDLAATGLSEKSSNYNFGNLIAQGISPNYTPEGLAALKNLKVKFSRYPLLNRIKELVS